jgi:hypothetical protein
VRKGIALDDAKPVLVPDKSSNNINSLSDNAEELSNPIKANTTAPSPAADSFAKFSNPFLSDGDFLAKNSPRPVVTSSQVKSSAVSPTSKLNSTIPMTSNLQQSSNDINGYRGNQTTHMNSSININPYSGTNLMMTRSPSFDALLGSTSEAANSIESSPSKANEPGLTPQFGPESNYLTRSPSSVRSNNSASSSPNNRTTSHTNSPSYKSKDTSLPPFPSLLSIAQINSNDDTENDSSVQGEAFSRSLISSQPQETGDLMVSITTAQSIAAISIMQNAINPSLLTHGNISPTASMSNFKESFTSFSDAPSSDISNPSSNTLTRTPPRALRKIKQKNGDLASEDAIFQRWRSNSFSLLGSGASKDREVLAIADRQVRAENEIFPLCYFTKNILKVNNDALHMYTAVFSVSATVIWLGFGIYFLDKYRAYCFDEAHVSIAEANNDKHVWFLGLACVLSFGPLVTFNYYTYFSLSSFFFVYYFIIMYSPPMTSNALAGTGFYIWSQITHWSFIVPISLFMGYYIGYLLSISICKGFCLRSNTVQQTVDGIAVVRIPGDVDKGGFNNISETAFEETNNALHLNAGDP